ncbi:hypothetical protein EI555_007983, partial [Monodon monoceros]
VVGPLPAEEPGRVRPGTQVEEEERDDKVKPGHPQVCHLHFNLRTHLVLGRGVRVWAAWTGSLLPDHPLMGVLRPVSPQPWGLTVPSEVTARPLRARCQSDPPQGVGVGEAPSAGALPHPHDSVLLRVEPAARGGKRRDGGGKETGPREAHPGPAGSQRQEEARRAGPAAKPVLPPLSGPSGPQTSLLAPGLGVGDGYAEEAVPLEPSGEAGTGLVPDPGVGRALGREGVELSGRRQSFVADPVLSSRAQQGHPGLANLRPTQGRWVPARQPWHLLLRNPRRPWSFPRAHRPAAEPKGAGGFTPNLRKPYLGAGTQGLNKSATLGHLYLANCPIGDGGL